MDRAGIFLCTAVLGSVRFTY